MNVRATFGSSRKTGAHVLLVEDNPINQELQSGMLRRAGVRVTTAGDGEQALAPLAREPFDAVMMDCQMPRMDGYEGTRRLRAAPALARWQPPPAPAALPPLDRGTGLRSARGDAVLYQRLLVMFADRERDFGERFRDGTARDAPRHAHDLASVSAALGMPELRPVLEELASAG